MVGRLVYYTPQVVCYASPVYCTLQVYYTQLSRCITQCVPQLYYTPLLIYMRSSQDRSTDLCYSHSPHMLSSQMSQYSVRTTQKYKYVLTEQYSVSHISHCICICICICITQTRTTPIYGAQWRQAAWTLYCPSSFPSLPSSTSSSSSSSPSSSCFSSSTTWNHHVLIIIFYIYHHHDEVSSATGGNCHQPMCINHILSPWCLSAALWINEKLWQRWKIKMKICHMVAIIRTTIMVAAILMTTFTRAILTTTNTDDKRNH